MNNASCKNLTLASTTNNATIARKKSYISVHAHIQVMEKRKEIENPEENAQKWRRLVLEGVGTPSSSSFAASFDSLNNDCLVNMLSFL